MHLLGFSTEEEEALSEPGVRGVGEREDEGGVAEGEEVLPEETIGHTTKRGRRKGEGSQEQELLLIEHEDAREDRGGKGPLLLLGEWGWQGVGTPFGLGLLSLLLIPRLLLLLFRFSGLWLRFGLELGRLFRGKYNEDDQKGKVRLVSGRNEGGGVKEKHTCQGRDAREKEGGLPFKPSLFMKEEQGGVNKVESP